MGNEKSEEEVEECVSEGSGVDEREAGLEELVDFDLLCFLLRGEVAGEEIKLLGAEDGRDGRDNGDEP